MSELHDKLAGDLRLRGLARKTEIGYVQAVQRLERHCGKPADELTAEEVRAYFLHRVDQGMAASTLNVEICATKYLFEQTLKRDWDVWGIPPVLPQPVESRLRQRHVPIATTLATPNLDEHPL